MRDAVALRRVYLASRMSISQNLQLRPQVDALLRAPATVLHAPWRVGVSRCPFRRQAQEASVRRVGAPRREHRREQQRMQRRGPCAAVMFVLEERLSDVPVHVQVGR